MDLTRATDNIRAFLLEAGAHALKIQKGVSSHYKEGEQAVTQADLDISEMITDRLSYWLSQNDHILIDEESIIQISSPEEVFNRTRYQWALDPIDGTAGYAMGRDRWAVSLGLLDNGVPIGGGFYMPAIGALILVEDGQAYFTDVHTGEKRLMPTAEPMELNSQIFLESYFGFEYFWSDDMAHNKAWLNTPECAVQGCYSAFMRQAVGTTFFELFSIWDVAGAAAIARTTGHKIMSLENGREWERFTAQDFKDNWKLKSRWVMAHSENFDIIKNALTGKK